MKLIPNTVTRSVSRQVLVAKKNSPHYFFVGGIAGVIASTVMACRSTLKLEEAVDESKKDILKVKATAEDVGRPDGTYTNQDYHNELGHAYYRTLVRFGKLYGPPVVVGSLSIAALTGSHIQLTRRNTALTAAFAAISKAYEEYRLRVREEVGEERELEIHRAITNEKVVGTKALVKTTDPFGHSPYARVFDESSRNWTKDAERNRFFIDCQQRYMNQRLHAVGHVFLNEVYDALGFDRSSAGAVVGWVLDGEGDNYIDFGVFEAVNANFVNGNERNVWLDFNVDGVVYDKI